MTAPRRRVQPRWADPELDEASLAVARTIRRAVAEPPLAGNVRWEAWLSENLPGLEDGDRTAIERSARRVRAAFGSEDSIIGAWPGGDALVLREQVDRLIRVLNRRSA